MENLKTTIPGYEIFEYKIILTPHKDLAEKITHIKKDFNTKFGIEQSYISVPQLILANFKQVKAFEERICNRLRIIAMGSHPVKIELRDFGSLPTHTIHINVTSKLPVTDLVKKIREDAQRLMKLDADNKPHFIMDANIAIGIRLKPWQYEKAWLEYSHSHFTGRFIAKNMLLLKRRVGELKYHPVESFEFQNLPVETVQGELF